MKTKAIKLFVLLSIVAASCQKKESANEVEKKETTEKKAENIDTEKSITTSNQPLPETISSEKRLHKFTTLLHAASLMFGIKEDSNLTIFAPIDAAFANTDSYNKLLESKNKAKLVALLSNHIVDGDIKTETVKSRNKSLKIIHKDNATYVNGIKVISEEIKTSNGSLYLIEKIIE